jgi:hypothetical protein
MILLLSFMPLMQAMLYRLTQDLVPRIQALESRVGGVHNLPGRLLLLDQIAEELGMVPPTLSSCGVASPSTGCADKENPQNALQATAAIASPSHRQIPKEEEVIGVRVTARQTNCAVGGYEGATGGGGDAASCMGMALFMDSSAALSAQSHSSPGVAGSRLTGQSLFSKQQQWQSSMEGSIEQADLKASNLGQRMDKLTAEVGVMSTLCSAHEA